MRIFLITVLSVFSTFDIHTAHANTPVFILDAIPDAQLVGAARLRYLWWDVSDISLYAPQEIWLDTKPYALTLTYLRNFTAVDIAKQSIKEMRRQGLTDDTLLENWEEQMTSIFPDVEKGQQITGILDAQGVTSFYFDETPIGKLNDLQFGPHFFAIWLGEKTSHPKVR